MLVRCLTGSAISLCDSEAVTLVYLLPKAVGSQREALREAACSQGYRLCWGRLCLTYSSLPQAWDQELPGVFSTHTHKCEPLEMPSEEEGR